MNENINLCEILKDCQKGTKLYSSVHGEVEFNGIDTDCGYVIKVAFISYGEKYESGFTKDGRYLMETEGECLLFPSKDQRDWSKWQCPKPRFDPKTLQPFDRVLCRQDTSKWQCNMFSHLVDGWERAIYPFYCFSKTFMYAIPYNDDTKHLVGTSDEAPEYYRYWED